ncbi:MAG: DUF4270 family protein [Salinivirgaceae bacterium]
MNTPVSLKTFQWAGFFFVSLLLFSCTDDLNDVGLEISPTNQVFVYHDTLSTIHAYTTQLEELILINKSYLMLGYLVDERIGVFQNNFMAEVATLGEKPDFGTNPVPDSVILFLKYVSAYGDKTTPQTFAMYELNTNLPLGNIDSLPNNDAIINQYYDANKFLGSYTFTPKDTITVLRFKLPELLAQKLMDTSNFKYYDTVPNFSSNVFRGIYLIAKPLVNGGATCSFSISDSTFIQMYYHNDEDTLSYPFLINSSTDKCNLFQRSFNPNINLVPYQTEPTEALEQELCYVKSNYGSDNRIDITGLKQWADSGYVAINKAYLTVYADYTDTIEEQTFPGMSLGIYKLGDDFTKNIISDYYDSSTGQSGTAAYDTATNAYYIKLTQELFNTMQAREDTLSLVFTSTNEATSANRMILKGSKNVKKPILKITYTKLN